MNKWFIGILLGMSAVPTSFALADLGQITQTIEGVESEVKGSISSVNSRTLEAFKQAGVQATDSSTEDSGSKQTIKGKKDAIDVEVQLTQRSPEQTHVAIKAKEGPLKWNKDFAQQMLSKIIQSS